MLTELAGSIWQIIHYYYVNRRFLFMLIVSVILICVINVLVFKTNILVYSGQIDIKIDKIQSPFSRTLAFMRMNTLRPERLQVLEKYRPFFINLHYSMPGYTSVINYTVDGWMSGDDPYMAVAETMKILLQNYSMVEGVLFFHFDAWINPFQFDRMNFNSIWLAGPASSYICGGHTEKSAWIYWNNDTLRNVQNAKRSISKKYPNRFITDEFMMCGGWTDIYYIPRRFFNEFIDLSDAFQKSRTFHEIAIPTMLNMIDLTNRLTPFHTVITHLEDCWGGCCVSFPTVNEIKTKRCGHKIDLSNAQMANVLINILNSESPYLNKIAPKKTNNPSIWITYMWKMFGTD